MLRLCVRVCPCSYGEISGSTLGRARVNSGTNMVRASETETNTEAKGAEGGREVVEGGEEQEAPTSHLSCGFLLELHSEETSMLLNF